jgi:Integrase core domain
MSRLSIADKTFLEGVLAMSGGYVLDFTDGSFANLLADINIDIYDSEKYSGFGGSKANRLRALWKNGSDAEVSAALGALADYIEAKKSIGCLREGITDEDVAKIRTIASGLGSGSSAQTRGAPVTITTEATVTNNKISVEIHEDIYSHIRQYLAIGDYFHAVDESYKVAGIRVLKIPPRSPSANAYAERFVLTVRSELTDRLLILGEQHLRHVPTGYARHYNGQRPHRSRQLRSPRPDHPIPARPARRITRRTILGGLLNEYQSAA